MAILGPPRKFLGKIMKLDRFIGILYDYKVIFWSLLNWADFEKFRCQFGFWAIVPRVCTREPSKCFKPNQIWSMKCHERGFEISWFLGLRTFPLIQHTSVKHWWRFLFATTLFLTIFWLDYPKNQKMRKTKKVQQLLEQHYLKQHGPRYYTVF